MYAAVPFCIGLMNIREKCKKIFSAKNEKKISKEKGKLTEYVKLHSVPTIK
jgi:hypothetical protein